MFSSPRRRRAGLAVPPREERLRVGPGLVPLAARRRRRGALIAWSHCRFAPPPIHKIPYSLAYSAPLFLKRQRDRTQGALRGGRGGDRLPRALLRGGGPAPPAGPGRPETGHGARKDAIAPNAWYLLRGRIRCAGDGRCVWSYRNHFSRACLGSSNIF